jgi:predicted TIM-barrel fold metal-dependent hydrolase
MKKASRSWETDGSASISYSGPDKCMFASNFPVDSMGSTWTNLWHSYADTPSWLPMLADNKQAVAGTGFEPV